MRGHAPFASLARRPFSGPAEHALCPTLALSLTCPVSGPQGSVQTVAYCVQALACWVQGTGSSHAVPRGAACAFLMGEGGLGQCLAAERVAVHGC